MTTILRLYYWYDVLLVSPGLVDALPSSFEHVGVASVKSMVDVGFGEDKDGSQLMFAIFKGGQILFKIEMHRSRVHPSLSLKW
jgi:hypothetical protein